MGCSQGPESSIRFVLEHLRQEKMWPAACETRLSLWAHCEGVVSSAVLISDRMQAGGRPNMAPMLSCNIHSELKSCFLKSDSYQVSKWMQFYKTLHLLYVFFLITRAKQNKRGIESIFP